MTLESRFKSKGREMAAGGGISSSSSRKRPYRALLLVLSLGAALLCVVVMHKLRERRVFGLLLQDRDRQLLAIQRLLQREREKSKEMKRKLGDMKAETTTLRTQKRDLSNKLMETEATAAYLKEKQKEMEVALEEKQNQISGLADKEAESINANLRVGTLTELLKQKEAELEETKRRLMNQNTAKNNMPEEKITGGGTATDNAIERPTNSSEGRAAMEERNVDNSVEMTGNQQVGIPKEGQWVNFKTNADDVGLKHEDQNPVDRYGEVSGDQQLDEHRGEGGQMGRVNSLEVPKDEESDKLENTGSEQQVGLAGLTGSAKGEDPETRAGHGYKPKTKRRRRRSVRRGRESEKRNNGHFENSQNDENRIVTGEDANTNKMEANKKGEIPSDEQSKIPENFQVTEGLVIEDAGSDQNASERSEMTANPHADDVTRSKHGDGDRNELQDQEKDSKLEIPDDSRDDESSRTGNQIDSSGAKETRALSTDGQQQKLPNPESGASLTDHGGDGFNDEGENRGREGEAKSTEGQLDKSEKPQDDEGKYKSDGNEGDAATDLTKDRGSHAERQDQGVMKEAMAGNAVSNPDQTEVGSITNGHQSQAGASETVDSSSIREISNDEDGDLAEDAEHSISEGKV